MAIACCSMDGKIMMASDTETCISTQSISKVYFSRVWHFWNVGKAFSTVGMELTVGPFNSIRCLEMRAPHKPQNLLTSVGAIVILSILPYKRRGHVTRRCWN